MAFDIKGFYGSQKAKYTKEYRTEMYWFYLWNALMNNFKYEGLPESLPAEWIEGILRTNGIVGIGVYEGRLYATAGGYYGDMNGYIPTHYKGAIQGMGNIDGPAVSPAIYTDDVGDNPVIVGWNNASMAPDFDVYDTALALTEGRTSEDINIIFSRLLRIPIARNSKEKAVIESAIKSIINGNIEAISSDIKSLESAINGEGERQFLDLVDVKDTDKLQFLNQYMDNVLKRFMQRHGHAMQVTSKLAQQTNAEIHGADDISMIIPLEELKYRKLMIESLNKYYGEKYNFKASVEFGDLLKNNYDRIVNYIPNELNEKGVMNNINNDDVKGGEDNETNRDNSESADGDSRGE